MEKEELTIFFDPSEDKILGVFGDEVHVETYAMKEEGEDVPCVIIIPKKEYFRIWDLWIEGKKRYCELWGHYCGVMGYTFAEKFKEVSSITLNKMSPDWNDDVEETWTFVEVPTRTFKVTKFEDHCDFEHG